jgi:hypothetical protein
MTCCMRIITIDTVYTNCSVYWETFKTEHSGKYIRSTECIEGTPLRILLFRQRTFVIAVADGWMHRERQTVE